MLNFTELYKKTCWVLPTFYHSWPTSIQMLKGVTLSRKIYLFYRFIFLVIHLTVQWGRHVELYDVN